MYSTWVKDRQECIIERFMRFWWARFLTAASTVYVDLFFTPLHIDLKELILHAMFYTIAYVCSSRTHAPFAAIFFRILGGL